MDLEVVDVASVPQLQGIFAPVVEEHDAGPLRVVAGQIPSDLVGSYLRNGPNPRFTPLGGYLFPIDGDGMVHGIWFDGTEARYRNRFVRTPAIEVEEGAGRALWPGVMTGQQPTAEDVGPELAGTDRDLVDIHVIRHAGRLLALAEGERPFELDPELRTVGPYDFGGALPKMCAHPKIDPVTGEMVVFRYDVVNEPWLSWAAVGADGTVTTPETVIDLDGPHMIHDFVITAGYLAIFVCPLRFDIGAMLSGGSLLAWRPDEGTRVAVVERATGQVTWCETDAFWVWHFANAFEVPTGEGPPRIAVDMAVWSGPGMGLTSESHGQVVRAHLDLVAGTVAMDVIDDEMAEFPRIDDRRVGRPHRWFHTAGKDPDDPPTVTGAWNRLLRFDMETGTVQDRRGGRTYFGEAVFAPRAGSTAEDDGYVMTYTYDIDTLATHFVVLDAADVAGEPVVVLEMPHRVPFGLHGSWLPED